MRTVMQTQIEDPPLAGGLHWGAASDDEEEAGAAGMDGYTSSDDSYGGHIANFAFEGAVSEVDPYAVSAQQ